MNLKDAQQKLSSDISQLHETYQLISKTKHQFNELDVALLQQQLLYIYHSLLQVQGRLGQLPSGNLTQINEQISQPNPIQNQPETTQPETEVNLPLDFAIAATEVNNITAEEVLSPLNEPKAELENLAESVLIENHIETIEPETEEIIEEDTVVKEEITPEPTIIEQPIAETNNINTTLNFNFDGADEPTIDDLEKLMAEQEKETEIAKPEVQVTLPLATPVTKPVVEENANELSLLDKLSANFKAPDVYERIAREQQQSLKQAINLNKKIAFVNNLFNENTVEYAKAIEKLNSSSSVHEALRFFSELKHQYNWSNENVLVKDLEQLVEKRYA